MPNHSNRNGNSNPIVEALPPHEPPFLPLSLTALQNLSEIATHHTLSKLLTTVTTTLKSLSQVALQLGESFPPGSPVPQRTLSALDDTARLTVDSAWLVENMRDTLGSAIGEAREAARTANHRRRVGGGRDELFRPGRVGDGVAGRYVHEMDRKVLEYEGLDTSKYTNSPEYIDFRTLLWAVQHAVGGAVPSSVPDTRVSEQTQDGGVAEENIWDICPITLRPIEFALSSTLCIHSFEKDAIEELVDHGGAGGVECPAEGCTQVLRMDILKVGEEREGEGERDGEPGHGAAQATEMVG